MVDPPTYRAEPDPEFADRLERVLLQRLTAEPDGPRSSGGVPQSDEPVGTHTDPDDQERDAIMLETEDHPAGPDRVAFRRSPGRWLLVAAAAVAFVVVGTIAVTGPGDHQETGEPGTEDDGIDVAGDSDFALAVEASGVLTSPSADEVAQAMDGGLHIDPRGLNGTQVSGAGRYVSLRTCGQNSMDPSPECPAGFPADWSYQTGTVDGIGEVHWGVLGEANQLEVIVLDDRYFVASEIEPETQAPPTAWLIDAVSGEAGPLRWSDTPTTMGSPGQALVVCDDPRYQRLCFLPRVVDARDGTIQPLAVPDDAASDQPVQQVATGRIWVGTAPDGDLVGLAHSDDGGETWTEVALPEEVRVTSEELAFTPQQKELEVAADGDRVAVVSSWGEDRNVYVSNDAGQNWTTAAGSEPAGQHAQLYVLADGRLVLVWSLEEYPERLLTSTGTDWAALQQVDAPWLYRWFNVNQAGVAVQSTTTIKVSTDLTTWRTIDGLND